MGGGEVFERLERALESWYRGLRHDDGTTMSGTHWRRSAIALAALVAVIGGAYFIVNLFVGRDTDEISDWAITRIVARYADVEYEIADRAAIEGFHKWLARGVRPENRRREVLSSRPRTVQIEVHLMSGHAEVMRMSRPHYMKSDHSGQSESGDVVIEFDNRIYIADYPRELIPGL